MAKLSILARCMNFLNVNEHFDQTKHLNSKLNSDASYAKELEDRDDFTATVGNNANLQTKQ